MRSPESGSTQSCVPGSKRREQTLSSGFEQLDRIAIGVFQLDLLASRAYFHFIPKMQACLLQFFDPGRKIGYPKNHPVPPSGFLMMTVRHHARTRRSRSAEKNLDVFDRDGRELRQLLMFQLETKLPGIELDGVTHVLDLVPNAVKAQDKGSDLC